MLELMKHDLKCQRELDDIQKKAGWKDKMMGQPALRAMAFAKEGTPEIQIVHSCAKYFALGFSSPELTTKDIGFVGDFNKYGDTPTAVVMQGK